MQTGQTATNLSFDISYADGTTQISIAIDNLPLKSCL